MKTAEKKKKMASFCGNTALCRITEDLIFTDPYKVAPLNRWTSPQLDEDARRIREDDALKRAVSLLKLRFMSQAEALVHGDMHTGSIMVTAGDTQVIDPEFAFFGPIGFDVGKLIGNLLLSYFSQDGHATGADPRDDYGDWILEATEAVWSDFAAKFSALWHDHPGGDAYPRALFEGVAGARSLVEAETATLRRLFEDSLGFAGASMIRRTLGLAHNIDLELIEDPDRRCACERRNLRLARDLLVTAPRYRNIGQVTDMARRVRRSGDIDP
jgi:5-methylthioribose kinase